MLEAQARPDGTIDVPWKVTITWTTRLSSAGNPCRSCAGILRQSLIVTTSTHARCAEDIHVASSNLEYLAYDDDDYDHLTGDDLARQERQSRRKSAQTQSKGPERKKVLRSPRSEADQAFKCGHCRQFIGAPISGGRQRNHCPNCLYSKHVDGKMPGDRKATCHALMRPIGIHTRRNGEEVLIHECLGCGKRDPNRIAADDNPVLLLEIPPIDADDPPGTDEVLAGP